MINKIHISIILSTIIIVPSLFLKYFEASSMQLGTVFILITIFLFTIIYRINNNLHKNELYFILAFLISVICLSTYTIFYENNFNLERYLSSFIYLILFILGSLLLTNIFLSVKDDVLFDVLNIIFFILLLDGLVSTLMYQLSNDYKKTLFLFKEPSHFALTLLPLLFFILNIKKNPIFLILAFYIALFFQNLTLLLGLIMITFLFYIKKIYLFIFLFIIIFIIVYSFIDFSYFLSRLDLSKESDNVSSLVFLSGWARAYENFFNTNGVGIGFQQLGYSGYFDEYQEIIFKVSDGMYLNLYDGGTIASKLISETGLIGIILIFFYLKQMLKYIYIYMKYSYNFSGVEFFFFSIYIFFFLELFIRGSGYFTGTTLLFLTASLYLSFRKKVKNSVFYKANSIKLNKRI